MEIPRRFTEPGKSPYEGITFAPRSCKLTKRDGSVVFSQDCVLVPDFWDQTSADVLAQKYFRRRGVDHTHANSLYNSPFAAAFHAEGPYARPGDAPDCEEDLRETTHRLVGCWTAWGIKLGYFSTPTDAQSFYDEVSRMIVTQTFAPNSPQWFNTGLHWAYGITGTPQGHYYTDKDGKTKKSQNAYEHPASSACFIQGIEDNLVEEGGIADLWLREARVFKHGGGTGTNFSKVRGRKENMSGGGTSSGLMSFLRVNDRAAGSIKSGGTTRRAAKLVCLDLDHPDIEAFIDWKMHEERKVAMLVAGRKALLTTWENLLEAAKAHPMYLSPLANDATDPRVNLAVAKAIKQAKKVGVPAGFIVESLARIARGETTLDMQEMDTDWQGEAYDTVAAQNANNSIRIPDAFMEAVLGDQEWTLTRRTDGSVLKTLPAKDLWNRAGQAAWSVADPGVQFDSTFNFWHTCPEDGRQNATNPCQPAFAPVLTPHGISTMGALSVGDTIWSGSAWTTITAKVATGVKPVFSYHTRAGSFVGTAEHRVLSGGTRVEVSNAETIDTCHGNLGETTPTTDYQSVMDGLVIGDGSCVRANDGANNYMVLTVGAEDRGYFTSEVAPFITETPYDTKSPSISCHRVDTTITPDELPPTYDRTIPDRFFHGSADTVRAFLRGLYSANGSVCGSRVTLKASSFRVIDRVQQMLSSLGIASYYTTNKAKDVEFTNGTYPCKESYDLNITHGRFKFQQLIGFLHEDKNRRLAGACALPPGPHKKYSYEVVSVEALGEMPVWDITVEAEAHTYWTGGLLVSNCSEYSFLDDTACNLGSVNLVRFLLPDGSFDVEGYVHACRLLTIILDITVGMSQYPSKVLAENSFNFRTLGGGYANLGGLLMRMGLPYDSRKGRDLAAALTAVLTGVAYATSAEMAQELGAFPGYQRNAEHVLRVLRNHKYLAFGSSDLEGDPCPSVHYLPLDPLPGEKAGATKDLTATARKWWTEALIRAEAHGVRNAQVTVLAPTGTIGIVMNCDTTGVEPDFALVKYKKLAGGGYMKLVNDGVPAALRTLGYTEDQITNIIDYISGKPIARGTTAGITEQDLIAAGYSKPQILAWDTDLRTAFDPTLVLPMEALNATFSKEALEAFLLDVGGRGTIEGAPELQEKHLAVFDCASRCGVGGKRFIRPQGHLAMMAAVQPFITGSISKTVNVPGETTVEEVKALYMNAWSMGIKAVAIYRDGSKLSQPMATSMDLLEAAEAIQDPETTPTQKVAIVAEALTRQATRRKLPPRRGGVTQAVKITGTKFYLRTGEYEDGTLGEIFLDSYKDGVGFRAILNSFAIAISIGLQYGVPLEEFCEAYLFTKFEPNGMVQDHPVIRMCTSVLDLVFRDLAITYLGQTELAVVNPEDLLSDSGPMKSLSPGHKRPSHTFGISAEEVADVEAVFGGVMNVAPAAKKPLDASAVARQQGFTGDPCPSCGHLTMVRNGTCAKCTTCGGTSGCS